MGKVTKFNSEAYAILEATPTQSRLIIYFEELELIFCTFVQPNKTRFWKARFNGGLQGLLRPRNPRNSQHLLPHLLSLLEVLRTDLLLDQYYRRRWGPLQATDLKYSYASTRRMPFISPQLYQCMHCFLFFFRFFGVFKSLLTFCSVPRECICKKHLSSFVASENCRTQMITPCCLQIKAFSFLSTVRWRVYKESENFYLLRRACCPRWTLSS